MAHINAKCIKSGNVMKHNEIIGQFEIFKFKAQESLGEWLDKELPRLNKTDWWKSYVLEKVTEEQLRSISEKNVSSMRGLDFAQLLKILDRNWFELSQKHSFSQEHKTYVNALQAARNRWSHKPTNEIRQNPNGISDDDLYRDLDTIRRFMQLFNTTSQETLDEIQEFKQFIVNPIPLTPELISQTIIRPTIQGNNFTKNVEYVFIPADENEFKNQLLKNRFAFIKIIYEDGRSDVKNWAVKAFTEASNLRNNINSKTWFRKDYVREKGVIKAIFSIKPF